MIVYLLRHGRTAYNTEHRYQGVSDIPLSAEGEAELIRADFAPDTVYVSPLRRAGRTAEILFPTARQVAVPALAEMNFGVFEGRSYIEMEHDADYRAWVDGGCTGRCPGGEALAAFCERVCGAFADLVALAQRESKSELTILAHGGVQMAVMERFAQPEKGYFAWHAPCAGGFVLECEPELWQARKKMKLIQEVKYTKE